MQKFLALVVAFLALFAGCGSSVSPSQRLVGKVVAIADGDTFTLLTAQQRQVKVRLHGIDCPERRQPYGQVARQYLSERIFGKQVTVEQKNTDRYKRVVGVVYDAENNNINEMLLSAGLAWHYKRYDNNSSWAALERTARRERRGLWADPDPVAPWNWRRKK